jgi:hypothetical protein
VHPVLIVRGLFSHFDLTPLSSYIILIEIRLLEHLFHHLISKSEFALGFHEQQVLPLRRPDFSLVVFASEKEWLLSVNVLGRLHVPPPLPIFDKIIISILLHNVFKAARRLVRRHQIWIVELSEHLLSRAISDHVLLNVEDWLRLVWR